MDYLTYMRVYADFEYCRREVCVHVNLALSQTRSRFQYRHNVGVGKQWRSMVNQLAGKGTHGTVRANTEAETTALINALPDGGCDNGHAWFL